MFRLSKFAQYAASAKNALSSRDAATTQQNLETINSAVVALKGVIDKYEGGLIAAAPISSYEATLGQHIKNATADAKASEPVTEEESKAVIAYITEVLEPNIQACMKALEAKKELLATAKLQGTTLGDLEDLRKATAAFSEALVEKAHATQKEAGTKVNAVVDTDFESAIKIFS